MLVNIDAFDIMVKTITRIIFTNFRQIIKEV